MKHKKQKKQVNYVLVFSIDIGDSLWFSLVSIINATNEHSMPKYKCRNNSCLYQCKSSMFEILIFSFLDLETNYMRMFLYCTIVWFLTPLSFSSSHNLGLLEGASWKGVKIPCKKIPCKEVAPQITWGYHIKRFIYAHKQPWIVDATFSNLKCTYVILHWKEP
jgi:hypothetical protein